MFSISETVCLAEWIIDDTCLVYLWIHAQAQNKLEKWFIISGDGVRTKQNKPIKELNYFSS